MGRGIFGAVIVCIACGCSAVYSTRPVGDHPKNLSSERGEWEGTWLREDGAICVKVVEATNGLLRVGWVEEEGAGFKMKTADVFLRDSGDWTFASVKDADSRDADRYYWGRIKRDGRQVVLWAPNLDKFKALVKAGALPGSLINKDVVLGSMNSNEMALITAGTNGVLFSWDEPLFLMKATK